MKEVTVKRGALLEVLKENMRTHQRDYDQMHTKYLHIMKGTLAEALIKIEQGEEPDFDLSDRPNNHIRAYEQAIKMVDMSVDETITLTFPEFTNLVMDDWSWKREFNSLKTAYGL